MSYWNYMPAILCFLLGGYLIIAAYRRRNNKHRHFRALAGVIAVGCLYYLFAFKHNEVEKNPASGEIILLTDGASLDTLNQLIVDKPSAAIFTNDPSIATRNNKAIFVNQLDEIPGLYPGRAKPQTDSSDRAPQRTGVTTIHLLGNGLGETELRSIENKSLRFYPAVLPPHFTSVNWPREVKVGDKLIIQGSFNNNNKRQLTLILSGFGTRLDSLRIPAAATTPFELTTIPKQNGRAVYSLLVMDGKDTLEQEKIPFETISQAPLQILMLASSPDFENKFLKNWLFSNNYRLAIRTTVSKDKYNTEYLNLSGIKTERINSNLLSKFDVVIGDATALNQLAPAELSSIRSAVIDEGLGLIVKVDSITNASRFFNIPFRYKQSASANSQVLHLKKQDTATSIPTLTAIRPLIISKDEQLKTVISDKEGQVFSAVTVLGSGKILASTIANTYNWVLAGDSIAYRSFWSDLIAEVAKPGVIPQSYSISPAIAVADMPVSITMESPDSLPPVMDVNRAHVALHQQFSLPFQWTGIFWPRKSGWQTTISTGNQSFHWYAFSKEDWKGLRANHTIAVNKAASAKKRDQQLSAQTPFNSAFSRYRKLCLIIMFMICCTYLWLEEKYHYSR